MDSWIQSREHCVSGQQSGEAIFYKKVYINQDQKCLYNCTIVRGTIVGQWFKGPDKLD